MLVDAVLIFDADNTLWHTNAIFRAAQLAALRVLAEASLIVDPEAQLETLRTLDRELVRRMGRFEYDFRVLLAAVSYHTQGLPAEEAITRAITRSEEGVGLEHSAAVERAHAAFRRGLDEVPPLYPDAEAILTAIRSSQSDQHIITVLFSEGDPERVERTLRANGVREREFFDEIIVAHKSREAFEAANELGLQHLPQRKDGGEILTVSIGDALRRDIKFCNQAGFITVYIPSDFHGREEPQEPDEEPCFTIESLRELPAVLRGLGVPLHSLIWEDDISVSS